MTATPRDTPEGLLADARQCWLSLLSIYQHDDPIPVPRSLLEKWLADLQPVLDTLRARVDPVSQADTFGARIRAARERLGLTQAAAAPLVGVKQSLFSRIEQGSRGESKVALVRQLAQGLGCSADYLVGLTQAPVTRTAPKKRKGKQ